MENALSALEITVKNAIIYNVKSHLYVGQMAFNNFITFLSKGEILM